MYGWCRWRRIFWRVPVSCLLLIAINTAVHFPYHTDPPVAAVAVPAAEAFYGKVYETTQQGDHDYITTAFETAKHLRITERVQAFAECYGLKDKRVLDVGAGTGYLQDVIEDYTGLDISPTARRFFHRPFVVASATAMPFRDSEFDSVWSVWVLEHVPNPEQMLMEMRRVVKDNGLVFLLGAWNCRPWAADGYEVRPYRDLDWKGKLIKASIPLRRSRSFEFCHQFPIRLLRFGWARLTARPTRLHYHPLEPNFNHYWTSDSDAVNSIDRFEAALWFTSRGDECLNCSSNNLREADELILRIHKSTEPRP